MVPLIHTGSACYPPASPARPDSSGPVGWDQTQLPVPSPGKPGKTNTPFTEHQGGHWFKRLDTVNLIKDQSVCVHLLWWEVVQLDKKKEVDEVSITSTVGRINRAECLTVELTELNRQRPLLSSLI